MAPGEEAQRSDAFFFVSTYTLRYQYDWSHEEAAKNILRTHTTAVSSRMLYKLAQQKEFTPVKYFSIDRVFRNETLDATHLAEFHQVRTFFFFVVSSLFRSLPRQFSDSNPPLMFIRATPLPHPLVWCRSRA